MVKDVMSLCKDMYIIRAIPLCSFNLGSCALNVGLNSVARYSRQIKIIKLECHVSARCRLVIVPSRSNKIPENSCLLQLGQTKMGLPWMTSCPLETSHAKSTLDADQIMANETGTLRHLELRSTDTEQRCLLKVLSWILWCYLIALSRRLASGHLWPSLAGLHPDFGFCGPSVRMVRLHQRGLVQFPWLGH